MAYLIDSRLHWQLGVNNIDDAGSVCQYISHTSGGLQRTGGAFTGFTGLLLTHMHMG